MLNLGAGIQLRLMLFWSNFKLVLIFLTALAGIIIIVYFAYPALITHQQISTSENSATVTDARIENIQTITKAIEVGDYDLATKEQKIIKPYGIVKFLADIQKGGGE